MSGRPPVSNPSLQPPIGSMASVERRTLRVLGELGKGRLDHRIAESRKDEFGELFAAFDQAAEHLDQRHAKN